MADYELTDTYWVSDYWFATYFWWPLGYNIFVPSLGRTHIIPEEDRDLMIELDDRGWVIPNENRRLDVNVS